MPRRDKGSISRGSRFEIRVSQAIRRLETIGFAKDLKLQDRVKDRDGHARKVDLSFVLCTWAVEILVSVECKSRNKLITLDEVDQIKVFRRELPERNIFWLVVDGDAGATVNKGVPEVCRHLRVHRPRVGAHSRSYGSGVSQIWNRQPQKKHTYAQWNERGCISRFRCPTHGA